MARTQSEIVERQDCCGFNSLKIARYLNLGGGLALCVVCVMRIISIASNFVGLFIAVGELGLNCFLFLFGAIIMAASFNMPCIATNFYLILTGMGKGAFNIFIGLLLLCDIDANDSFNPLSFIMSMVMLTTGVVFIFLSKWRNMSDDELQRATSIATKEVKKKVYEDSLNYARDHKDEIK